MKTILLLFPLLFVNSNSTIERLTVQTKEVKKHINDNSNWNREIAFFIDMKVHSGKNRFFVYDLKNNKVIDQGLVAHGSGSETGIPGQLKFSNIDGSYCTSLGKYTIGGSYQGRFGKAYTLQGLDSSNSNALTRHIVLHKFSSVPYNEQEENIVNSLGCPMVNEQFYNRLQKIIDNSKTKILLSIYY
jgi:L,D-transpeptidase catalytic domain